MQTTTHYALKKPDLNDAYNHQANDNANMDVIDAQMYVNAQAASSAQTAANNAQATANAAISNSPGSVTDSNIGNRTADPTRTPTGIVGTLTQWLSWITNRIIAITGKTNWYDAPDTTLAALSNQVNQDVRTTASPSFVTVNVSSSARVNNLNAQYVNGYSFDQSVKTTDSPTFAGLSLTGIISRIKNILTAGNFGVLTCLANTTEQLLNTTNATDILTFTPPVNGNYEAKLYIRCANANTQVTAVVTWTDASGNQRTDTITSSQLLNVDGYSAPTAFFNAITSGPIKITVTAGTAGNIYCSATILGV